MTNFLQWYKQSTKNKIIIFSIAFIFTLAYSFLHRPLGLIMWYELRYIKENNQTKTTTIYVDNRDKFLEIYKEQNITNKLHKNQKELFKYIDDFERDLLATSFVGLSELYLQAFLSKSKIYIYYFNLYIAYEEYHKKTYTMENVNMLMEFLDKNEKISFFIDRLALKDDEFESYMFQQSIIQLQFVFPAIYFLSQEEVCAIPNKEKISNVLIKFNNAYQKMNSENETYKIGKERLGDAFDENLQKLFNLHNMLKEKIYECQ